MGPPNESEYLCSENAWPGILQRLKSCGLFLKPIGNDANSFEVRNLPDEESKVCLGFEDKAHREKSRYERLRNENSLIEWTSYDSRNDWRRDDSDEAPLISLLWILRVSGADRFRDLRIADQVERELLAAGAVCKRDPVAPHVQKYLKTPRPAANEKSN